MIEVAGNPVLTRSFRTRCAIKSSMRSLSFPLSLAPKTKHPTSHRFTSQLSTLSNPASKHCISPTHSRSIWIHKGTGRTRLRLGRWLSRTGSPTLTIKIGWQMQNLARPCSKASIVSSAVRKRNTIQYVACMKVVYETIVVTLAWKVNGSTVGQKTTSIDERSLPSSSLLRRSKD